MRQTLLITLLSIGLSARSQTFVAIGAGGAITKRVPAFSMQLGRVFWDKISVKTGYKVHVDRKNPAIFDFQAGPVFTFGSTAILVTGGSGYKLTSTDRTDGNGFVPCFSIEGIRPVYDGSYYLEISSLGRYVFAIVGYKYFFPRKYRRYDR